VIAVKKNQTQNIRKKLKYVKQRGSVCDGGGEGAVGYWLSHWTLELNSRMITVDEVRQWGDT